MLKTCFAKLYSGTQESFFSEMDSALESASRRFVITLNPEVLISAETNDEMACALLSDDTILVPDGIGVVRAAETLGKEMHGRVTGVELSAHLLAACDKRALSVYLYGAKEETMADLKEKVSKNYPNLRLLGAKNGYDFKDDEVFDEVVTLSPDVVLVALGAPRQETLLFRHLSRFDKGIFVGVGGSFDVLSGKVRRAPRLFVKLNLEWLWRILREPRRIIRFYKSNTRFLSRVRKLKKELAKKKETL